MNYVFSQPQRVMVGAIGEVGQRLFLLQIRDDKRLLIIKCEKQQLAALAEWIGQVIDALGRPGHLPEDYELEKEYEVDFAAGDITVAVDADAGVIELAITSSDEDDHAELTMSREMAGGLAIAIARLVEAGRPLCPLCAGPLDPRGHDCPRTNGHRAPLR